MQAHHRSAKVPTPSTLVAHTCIRKIRAPLQSHRFYQTATTGVLIPATNVRFRGVSWLRDAMMTENDFKPGTTSVESADVNSSDSSASLQKTFSFRCGKRVHVGR